MVTLYWFKFGFKFKYFSSINISVIFLSSDRKNVLKLLEYM